MCYNNIRGDDKMSNEEIRKAIINQEKPFCINDIIYRLNKEGIYNNGNILYQLDRLYNSGIIKYDKVGENDAGEPIYAFISPKYYEIINQINNNKKLTR